jgi:hypothetical protein
MVKQNSSSTLINQLNPRYFWDVDISKLDDNIAKRLIIERVVSLGSMLEINLILKHYGRTNVIEVICRLNYLDPKTFNFISKLFNLPKNAFKCYTRKQLLPKHWNS